MTYQIKPPGTRWVIDWDRVQTIDDLKRLLMMCDMQVSEGADVSGIKHLLRLEDKPGLVVRGAG